MDSGIFLREESEEIQIGVSRSMKRDMTFSPYIAGEGYTVMADVKKVLKFDEWNSFSITAVGGHYTATLNGTNVLDFHSQHPPAEGAIGFQLHPATRVKIEYRNLEVQKLSCLSFWRRLQLWR